MEENALSEGHDLQRTASHCTKDTCMADAAMCAHKLATDLHLARRLPRVHGRSHGSVTPPIKAECLPAVAFHGRLPPPATDLPCRGEDQLVRPQEACATTASEFVRMRSKARMLQFTNVRTVQNLRPEVSLASCVTDSSPRIRVRFHRRRQTRSRTRGDREGRGPESSSLDAERRPSQPVPVCPLEQARDSTIGRPCRR